MVATSPHKIILENPYGAAIRREALAADEFNPGMLLEMDADKKFDKHSEANGPGLPLFAVESPTPDTYANPTTQSIDIPYTAGDTAYAVQPQRGMVIYAWLADGANVQKGRNFLASNGTGHLDDIGTGNIALGTSNPVGVAWQDKDNSAGGTAVRCKVLIV